MTLSKRMFAIILASFATTLLVFGIGAWGISQLAQIQDSLLASGKSIKNQGTVDMMHDAMRGDALQAVLIVTTKDKRAGTLEDVKAAAQEHSVTIHEALDANSKLQLSATAEQALSAVPPLLDAYDAALQALVDTAHTKPETIFDQFSVFISQFEALEEKLGQVTEVLDRDAEEVSKKGLEVQSWVNRLEMISLAIACLIGVLSLFMTKQTVVKILERVSARLTSTCEKVAGNADQIAASAESLAQGATEQAASLEETSASLKEVSSSASNTSVSVETAQKMFDGMAKLSENGGEATRQMKESIEKLNAAAQETEGIIKTIDEIAFQTNLLALNAAVEAARAGEAGKGFAVVAEEVRSLAQRSSAAARDTTERIRRSHKLATEGAKVADSVELSLNSILDSIRETGSVFNKIAEASSRQSSMLKELDRATSEVSNVVQQNSAAAEESAASGAEMQAQATELRAASKDLALLLGR